MGDFENIDHLVASMAQRSETFPFHREYDDLVSVSHAEGSFGSLWIKTGFPSPAVAPTGAATLTKASVGSIADFTNPGAGEVVRIAAIEFAPISSHGGLFLYDRLVHVGGLVGNSTSVQTVNTPAIPRGDTNGVGVMGWWENYVSSTTARTVTISYTNSLGTSGRTGTVTITTNMIGGALAPIVLQTGDVGIRSVETAQILVGGIFGSAGNFGITLGRRICYVGAALPFIPTIRSGFSLGFPLVEPDACLWLVGGNFNSTDGFAHGSVTLIRTG